MTDRESEDEGKVVEASAADGDAGDEAASSESDADDRGAEPAAAAGEGRPRKKRSGEKARSRERREQAARAVSRPSSSLAGLLAVVGLAVGAAGGWFGHIAQAKAKLKTDSAPAASGSASGPCGAWRQKLCSSGGDESALCAQATAASDILTSGTCEVALDAVPATLAKVKAARAGCDQLMTKLCADLPPESPACKLVKEKTPAFPASRCTEMLGTYPEVIAGLKQLHEQLSAQNGPGMNGMPGMGAPPAAGAPHP